MISIQKLLSRYFIYQVKFIGHKHKPILSLSLSYSYHYLSMSKLLPPYSQLEKLTQPQYFVTSHRNKSPKLPTHVSKRMITY